MPRRREVASTILSVFKQQQSRPGYKLPIGLIAALAEREGWTIQQLLTGIEYGCSVGLFEIGPKLCVHLTDTGFSAATDLVWETEATLTLDRDHNGRLDTRKRVTR